MTSLRSSLSLTLAVALLAAVPAPAPAALKPKMGLYDCYSFDPNMFGGLVYQNSIRLKGGGVYQHGWRGQKGRLKSQTNGKWRQKGVKITFQTGVMRKTYVKVVKRKNRKEPVLALFAQGETSSGIDCYFNKDYR